MAGGFVDCVFMLLDELALCFENGLRVRLCVVVVVSWRVPMVSWNRIAIVEYLYLPLLPHRLARCAGPQTLLRPFSLLWMAQRLRPTLSCGLAQA